MTHDVHQVSTRILAVGHGDGLRDELAAACSGLTRMSVAISHVSDLRLGLETARAQCPDVVVIDVGFGTESVQSFAAEVSRAAPGALIVVAYQAELLRDGELGAPSVIDLLRATVRDFLRRPIATGELRDVLARHLQEGRARGGGRQGRIVSLVSNKGGVGKSTLAVNLACALGRSHPDRVLLVDASLQLGVCAAMLGIEPTTTLVDAVRDLDRLDETLLRELSHGHESGVRLLAAPRDAAEAASVDGAALARVLAVARRDYDHVVVDTFPILDGVTVALLDVSDLVYVVFAPFVPIVIGLPGLLGVLERLGLAAQRRRLILNHCMPRHPGRLLPKDVATRIGVDIDHVVPFRQQLLTAMNTGRPLALSSRGPFSFGRVLRPIVREIQELGGGQRTPGPAEPTAAPAGGTAA